MSYHIDPEALRSVALLALIAGIVIGCYIGAIFGAMLARPRRNEKVVLRAALDTYLAAEGLDPITRSEANVLRYGATLRE